MEESLIAHLHVIDSLNLCFIEPFDALAILPQAELNFIVARHNICAKAMLFTLVPVSLIASLISPSVDPKTVLLIILVLPAILSSIVPDVDAHTLHVIVQPLTLVFASIKPRIDSNATDFVFPPVTSIHGAIVPLIAAYPMLPTKGIVSLVA